MEVINNIILEIMGTTVLMPTIDMGTMVVAPILISIVTMEEVIVIQGFKVVQV
jgi:hypothetical protein